MPLPKINVIKFLKCYEKRPCLWDPTQEEYRYNDVRTAAHESILEEMKIPMTVKELRAKIKNIRTTYHREVSKIIKTIKKKNSDEIYTPQLSWFSTADRFLRPVIEEKRMRKRNSNPTRTEDSNSSSFSSDENTDTEPVVKKQKPAKVPVVQETNECVLKSRNNRQDEFDTFGQHVANQLRGLPLKNAFMCQNVINNYISQERLRLLDEQQVPSPIYLSVSRRTSSASSDYKFDPSSP